LNTGSYSASVVISTVTFATYTGSLSGGFPAVAATAYPPPSVQSFSAVSPQTGGCDSTGCTGNFNGTLALTPGRANTLWNTILRSPEATTGVRFISGSQVSSSGAANFNTDTYSKFSAAIGGMSMGVFAAQTVLSPLSTILTAGDAYAISGQATEQIYRTTYFSESVLGAKQASVTLTGGGSDKVAPTCTVVTVAPTTVTTVKVSVPVTLTITCADNTGGAGLWTVGYFGTASVTSGAGSHAVFGAAFTAGTSTQTIGIPPYITGTFTVAGVFAADNAGNVALYGSCAGAPGFDSIGCSGGGGSSSASTAAFSLVSIVVLALFALLKL